MKKTMLFVIDSLNCAGAEKSLTSLLSLLDYSEYSVDLMLFAHGGAFEELLPEDVRIVQPLKYMQFSQLNIKESLLFSISNVNLSMFMSRIKYSIKLRFARNGTAQEARIFWQSVSDVIECNPKEYDIAISYAQGVPTFYVADKVKAKEKYAWVNVSYRLDEKERQYQKKFYNKYKKIVGVSHSAKEVFVETFPYFLDKTHVIYDINNFQMISKMAEAESKELDDKFDGVRILTIGRLSQEKGYDIALDACKKLKEKGIKFKWYSLGKGPLKKELEDNIKKLDLYDNFVLLGVKSNPYPIISKCDIYVQTSRHEGFGLAIAEARMLNIPVVSTRFDSVYNQMIDGKNGLVVDMTGEAVAEGVQKLINDNELRENITKYLKCEKKGNIEELEKFYELIN
ncbi:glycosyl transferase [Paenibacillus pectinilyticus]|uniref:Glycosyl transferase n=1 Tax=Paenibacillus pectinilyticus TaxID=512399 RepID=A0A1C0ZSI7_9BACL|nr:glycosyltransferase [Paenibacillus pectinilyticus]OCT11050.1 glycosyl transferase [Paenibacillus pectinilyticus]